MVGEDPCRSVDGCGELLERACAVLPARLQDDLPKPSDLSGRPLRPHGAHELAGVHVRVPHLLLGHPGEPQHRLAVRARRDLGQLATALAGKLPVAARDREARGEPLHVPLPRPGQGLSKSFRSKRNFRSGEPNDPEVGQVGVTAELRAHARPGSRGEIRCHERRSAAVERERRGHHPAVADGHEPGTRLVVCASRMPTGSGRSEAGVHSAWLERGTPLGPLVRAPGCRHDWRSWLGSRRLHVASSRIGSKRGDGRSPGRVWQWCVGAASRVLGVLMTAVDRYFADRCPQLAAGIAYRSCSRSCRWPS
jgi:hypothetical protein